MATLALIYLGTVTDWGDPRIAADNPGLSLPDRGNWRPADGYVLN